MKQCVRQLIRCHYNKAFASYTILPNLNLALVTTWISTYPKRFKRVTSFPITVVSNLSVFLCTEAV